MATEARKTVTVFFCDVTGSTDLGERLDPESQRHLMSRYFETISKALIAHGGSVEKFIGDAVMAVFGIPQLHEDDALRAVRAAAEARDELARLNDELERDRGVRIQVRMGVNTGEVVAGDPTAGQNLVTGDAVNVAARLEQAAVPGEILIGPETYRLVREAVRTKAVEPLELKGKAERVPAYRVLEAPADSPAFLRRLDAPFVGRAHELELLQREFERTVEERSCRLVTLIGAAGIGKSRLVLELTSSLRKRAKTLSGHCLPYGEGITYWPLVEIVKELGGGGDARSTTTALFVPSDEAMLIAERISGAVGQTEATGPNEEIFWAVRKLLETLAKGRPLVVVLDDIHWAEQTFLDLVEYVLGFSTDAPILLLCVARPDLLDARPSWSAPRPNATTIVLDPLTSTESEELFGDDVPADERERILAAAEGNPLFVEQMLALRAENGDSTAIPPTIQALLAARIDRLEPEERDVIERASVEGRLFHRTAVAELAPEDLRPRTSTHLLTLVRKELIRPDRAEFENDDGFRFGHILIRDAAYSAMPKELRAQLHQRYADWLERQAGERIREYEEILGFHLEQAYRLRAELGPIDPAAEALGLRAADHLATAGRRAHLRGDSPAAIALLDRAVLLLSRQSSRRVELLTQLGAALGDAGQLAEADEIFRAAATLARELGDERLEWRARIELLQLHSMTEPDGWVERARTEAHEAVGVFEAVGDEAGLARAKRALAMTYWMQCQGAETLLWNEEAAEHARRARDQRELTEILVEAGAAAIRGPTPVAEAIPLLDGIADELHGNLEGHAAALSGLALLHAMAGRFDKAKQLLADAHAILAELAPPLIARVAVHSMASEVARRADGLAAAEHSYRAAADALAEAGERSFFSTMLGELADLAAQLGRDDDALRLAAESEEAASADDTASQALIAVARARVLARRGELEAAEELVREAIARVDETDFPEFQALPRLGLADVLEPAGRHAEAAEALEEARLRYERKGDTVNAERVAARLAALAHA